MIPMTRLPRLRLALPVALLALSQIPAQAQERVRPFEQGDGRIHGAPVLQVSEVDLHVGQVQTLNLAPGYHTILEFPYPVARVDAGDLNVFTSDIIGNKLALKATRLSESETSMTVILADENLTVIPFLVRADSTQPVLYVVRYTDPLVNHLNDAEQAIAHRLEADVDRRVSALAEQRLRQVLLFAASPVEINKSARIGGEGERFTLEIESAQTIPDEDGTPQLYLRYRVLNQTITPLADLHFVVRIQTSRRHNLVGSETVDREIYDIQDVRTNSVVPPGTAARGLLIFDAPELRDGDALSVEALGYNNQRSLRIDRVLVAN